MSLGSGLDREGRDSIGNDSDLTIPENSCDGSNNHNGMVVPGGGKDQEICSPNQYQGALPFDSLLLSSDMVNKYDLIFSIGKTQQSEKESRENSDESGVKFSDHKPHKFLVIVKSNSLPNIGSLGGHYALTCLVPQSRSSVDLTVQKLRQKMLIHDVERGMIHDSERDYSVLNNEKNNCENPTEDDYDAYNYVGSAKDWIVPEVNAEKNFHGESPARQWEELPSKDFKIKRIENWVIHLQHCSPEEETNDELSNLDDHQVQRSAIEVDNLNAKRLDGKITPGMEAAMKYVSSLSATSTTT
ncbi:hypothetical protein LOK49_LG07G02350 [Camellia lanceoleosa]|uniref:Uncharacterized protein n=1 Tax=Camellia lanceoleosa TaxID=1840588 RepID=A0ACC0H3X1_9ERIC|nr:hypothetical protein LOK49_LG07G02350 [Camellia lanceoleosa]